MRIYSTFLSAAAGVLVGCASAPQPASLASGGDDGNVDSRKVAAIDRAAKAQGVEIHWINLPQRHGGATLPANASPASDPPSGT